MTVYNLLEIENNIVKLCERAASKGWVFTSSEELPDNCGCVLQACASELGVNTWTDASDLLGIPSMKPSGRLLFALAFDNEADLVRGGAALGRDTRSDEWSQLGASLAKRFVKR